MSITKQEVTGLKFTDKFLKYIFEPKNSPMENDNIIMGYV